MAILATVYVIGFIVSVVIMSIYYDFGQNSKNPNIEGAYVGWLSIWWPLTLPFFIICKLFIKRDRNEERQEKEVSNS